MRFQEGAVEAVRFGAHPGYAALIDALLLLEALNFHGEFVILALLFAGESAPFLDRFVQLLYGREQSVVHVLQTVDERPHLVDG